MLASDSDQSASSVERIFLPLPVHGLALREHIMVIRGERGAGKTALFQFLGAVHKQSRKLEEYFPEFQAFRANWVDGFSESDVIHPSTNVLDAYGSSASVEQLRILWLTHLAGCLAEGGIARDKLPVAVWETWRTRRQEPVAWVEAAQGHLGPLMQWFDDVDRMLQQTEQTIVVTYDHLDRIGRFDVAVREHYAGTLLALWMSLASRYRRIRAKIFLREDLFEAAQRAFPDASKLAARSISLHWDVESLYRVLIRHMAELSEGLRDWLQRGGKKIPLSFDDVLGWSPPPVLPESGRASQKAFVDHLAGELMGKGIKKGYTYRWIPNHLQDAHVRIVPRSMIGLIGNAAGIACTHGPKAGYDRLLHPHELQAALERTSLARVQELQEEHRVVGRLENLRGLTVMIEQGIVQRHLARPAAGVDDGFGLDGRAAMDELIRLGVLKVRTDGRIDVPDIYRAGYGIKRKGGGARPH